MPFFRAFICLSLLATASASHAQGTDQINPKFLKNFTTLTALLRAHGVEPSRLQWGVIEQSCSLYNDSKDQTDYNRCRFEKGRDQAWSGADARSCNNEAAANYPDGLLSTNPTNVIRYRNGTYTTTTIQNPPTSYADLNNLRTGSYDACMSAKGWRDPHDYLLGRMN